MHISILSLLVADAWEPFYASAIIFKFGKIHFYVPSLSAIRFWGRLFMMGYNISVADKTARKKRFGSCYHL